MADRNNCFGGIGNGDSLLFFFLLLVIIFCGFWGGGCGFCR
ncbi:hypothetical protein [Proteiniborus sp.]